MIEKLAWAHFKVNIKKNQEQKSHVGSENDQRAGDGANRNSRTSHDHFIKEPDVEAVLRRNFRVPPIAPEIMH
jgi:hypothetical protein